MEKREKLLILPVILITFFAGVFFLTNKAYSDWGRTLFYSRDNKLTYYPGMGKFARMSEEMVLVIPQPTATNYQEDPFFVSPGEEIKYSGEGYETVFLPAQEEMFYAVGSFEGWENIGGTVDKYIILKYPGTGETEKFRVGFEESDLFKDGKITRLGVDDVSLNFKNELRGTEKPEKLKLSELTFEKTEKLIKIDDTVIVLPVLEPPFWSKQDQNGNYLASWIILRRVGGKATLDKEI